MSRRIVDARADSKGNISHVRLDGNQRFTPVATAIPMARYAGHGSPFFFSSAPGS